MSGRVLSVPDAYPTIGEAYAQAVDGDRIDIAAGTYTESLFITKAVELNGMPESAGAGAPRAKIQAPPQVVAMTIDCQSGASIRNLVLCECPGHPSHCTLLFKASQVVGKPPASGPVVVEGCEITGSVISDKCAVVQVVDSGCNPELRGCMVRCMPPDTAREGCAILLEKGSCASILNNEIVGLNIRPVHGGSEQGANSSAPRPAHGRGIVIRNVETNPLVQENKISGFNQGICVDGGARGQIKKNEIFHNAKTGLTLMKGADPFVSENDVHHGNEAGLLICSQARGRIDNNDIRNNQGPGIVIKNESAPTIRFNKIHSSKEFGVHVCEGGRGQLEENEIYENESAGVYITSEGDPTLLKNRIHDQQEAGVHVRDKGKGNVDNNDIYHNGRAGVQVGTDGNPTVVRNRIYNGKWDGVAVHNGKGTFTTNEIYENKGAGVLVILGADPVIRGNTIRDGKETGLVVYFGANATVEDNEIRGHARANVLIYSDGNPVLRRNKITHGQQAGVSICERGKGTFEDNEIMYNAHAGVMCTAESNPTLRRCKIAENKMHGVVVNLDGGGTFEDCNITANDAGVWAGPCSFFSMTGCTVQGNRSYGVYANETFKGTATVSRNIISANTAGNVQTQPGCTMQITDNQLS